MIRERKNGAQSWVCTFRCVGEASPAASLRLVVLEQSFLGTKVQFAALGGGEKNLGRKCCRPHLWLLLLPPPLKGIDRRGLF